MANNNKRRNHYYANKNRQQRQRNQSNGISMVSMPESFAKAMLKQILYNPRNTSGVKTNTYQLQDKDDIIGWLQSPSSNEQSLRNASNYMYLASMHYKRLITYYSNLYTGTYVVLPAGYNPESIKKESFAKNFYKASKTLEYMNIAQLMHNVFTVALREGAYYGVLWSDSYTSFIQRIDADYCKITSVCDGSFLYSVDMSKLRGKLEYYPAEFSQMYQQYLSDGQKWQEVPPNISFCVKGDSSMLDCTVPVFAATMPALYTIANVESLQETATQLKNYKMIAGEIPTDTKGNPLMDAPMVKEYYAHIANALGENVGLALAPFELKSLSFSEEGGVANVDDLSKAVASFWSTAGTSGLLHGRENDTAGVTKLAIKNDETFMLDLVQQYERLINRFLKTTISGTNKFKIVMLPITAFNKDEYIDHYKAAAALGVGKSMYAASLGIGQTDLAGMEYLETNLMPFDDLKPLKSTYNLSGDNPTGRPLEDDEDLSDEGETTRNNDTNANR